MAEQRLIDANNLIEEIREERCYNCRDFKDMKCDYCGTADYIYMIEDMPAVEESTNNTIRNVKCNPHACPPFRPSLHHSWGSSYICAPKPFCIHTQSSLCIHS